MDFHQTAGEPGFLLTTLAFSHTDTTRCRRSCSTLPKKRRRRASISTPRRQLSTKMEGQMKTSKAGSTTPDMHSTCSTPFGTLQPSPSTTRSESSTPTSCLSNCMAPKHGELPSKTPTSCRPLSTDASETSTSAGQTSFPTPTSGTRQVKAPLKWKSEKRNGSGSPTHPGSPPHLHKESEK